MTFLSSTAYIEPSHTIKSNPQGEKFQLISSLISVCCITKMFGVFGNRALPSSYGGLSKSIFNHLWYFLGEGQVGLLGTPCPITLK